MTDTDLRNADVRYELVAETGTDYSSEPPLRLLRRALRGRYITVGLLATLLALIGGLVGFKTTSPQYQSTGLIRIEGALPAILYESQENQVPPMFDAYVASQVTLLQSHQNLQAAIARPEMRNAGWAQGIRGVADLENTLTVLRGRGENIISVSVSQPKPARARLAVNAVLAAYRESTDEPGGLSAEAKQETLVQRETELNEELRKLREEILEISDQYGFDAINRMHAAKVEELVAVDRKLADIRLARTKLEVGGFDDELQPTGSRLLSGSDPKLAQLADEQLELQAQIASYDDKYGPNHPLIRGLARQLEAVRIQIDLRERAMADLTTAANGRTATQTDLVQASRDRLNQMEDRYEIVREQLREEAARLGHQRVALLTRQDRVTELSQRLAETRKRLDEIRVETRRDSMNRIFIAAEGDLPAAPIVDRRRELTAAGALFGAVVGVAIVFLIGLCDPRTRFVDDLKTIDESSPIVAVLPHLEEGDNAGANQAARSIHQLRNLLEVKCLDPNANVHTVTSCDRGEGKTSVALALGASFAAAGRKALVIDADVARHSLTRELRLDRLPGLCEAIGPSNSAGRVHQTSTENLWAMPIGSAQGLDPEDLSMSKLIWLLGALRNRFDAIIIDTGPILGSVEAGLVAAVSDRTVVVVGRDQKKDLIRSTLLQLHQVGSNCVGIVFNKAHESDVSSRESAVVERLSHVAALVPTTPATRHDPGGPLTFAVQQQAAARTDGEETRKRAA